MEPTLAALLTAAIEPTLERANSRIRRSVGRRRNNVRPTDIDIALRFDVSEIANRTAGIKIAQIAPSGTTVEQLKRTMISPVIQGVIGELLSHRITNLDTEFLPQIRERFYIALIDSLSIEESQGVRAASDALVEELDFLCTSVIERLRASDAEAFDSLKASGQLKLIYDTASTSRENLDHIRKYRLETPSKAHTEWLAQYRKQLIAAHGHIYPPNIDDRQKVPLESIYVTPEIDRGEDGQFDTVDIAGYANEIDRTVILGDPGGGKSTITSAIATYLAKNNSRVPFVVTLRDFAREDNVNIGILSYINSQLDVRYQCPAPNNAVESLLLTGEAVVIFDGLDELLDSSLRRTISERVELFSSKYPISSILATSRKVGYPEARLDPQIFQTDIIGGFNDAQIEEYARKWFTFAGQFPDLEVESAVETFLTESSQVPDLRSNPLMLSLICMIYRGQNYIPENRLRVLEKCAELLFNRWDRSRAIIVSFRASAHIDDALRHLAYWMYRSPDAIEGVTEKELVRETATFLSENYRTSAEAMQAAREFIDFCKGRAWVFGEAGTTPGGEPIFKFAHRTFLEYFAAHELTRDSDSPEEVAAELLKHVSKAEWDVVGQLAVQIVHEKTRNGASRVLLRLLNERRKRKAINRLNVLAFVGRCLSFSPTSPEVSKLFVSEAFQNLVRQAREFPSQSLSTEAMEALYDIHPDLLEYSKKDLHGLIRLMLDSQDKYERMVARTICVSFFKYNSSRRHGKHSLAWREWSTAVTRECAAFIDVDECEPIHLLSLEEQGCIPLERVLTRAADGGEIARGIFHTFSEPFLGFSVLPYSNQILRALFWVDDTSTPSGRLQAISERRKARILDLLDGIADLGFLNESKFPVINAAGPSGDELRPSRSFIFPRARKGQRIDSSAIEDELLTTRSRLWTALAISMTRFEIDDLFGFAKTWPESSNPLIAIARARAYGEERPVLDNTILDAAQVEFIQAWMASRTRCIDVGDEFASS